MCNYSIFEPQRHSNANLGFQKGNSIPRTAYAPPYLLPFHGNVEARNQNLTWNLGLFRIRSPYLKKIHDNGARATAMNPSNELPQPRPRAA